MNIDIFDSSILSKLKNWFKGQKNTLVTVTKSHGLFILIGFAYGVLFVILGTNFPYIWDKIFIINNIKPDVLEIISLIIKDIGIGFIVAAVAVFGYEWRSHSKHAIELSEKLIEMLESKAEEALNRSVRHLVKEDNGNEDFCNDIINFVMKTHNLCNSSTLNKIQYINVLSWIFQETVKKNADNLEGFVNDDKYAEWHYIVPNATELASRILGAQMKCLKKGDRYDSISMISSWQDDSLNYFLEETENALKKGVKVRRIFNLCNQPELLCLMETELSSENERKLEKILNAIKKHEDMSKRFRRGEKNKYEIKFLTDTSTIKAIQGFKRAELESSHYGLFHHSEPKQIIKFIAQELNLSLIGLKYCQDNDRDIKKFKLIWDNTTADNPFEVNQKAQNNSNTNMH